MRKILAGKDQMVANWVAKRIPIFEFGSTPYTAIGLANEGGILIAGVVYQNYTRVNLEMHVAAIEGCRWLSKEFLGEAFRYPFEQLRVNRVTALIPASNGRSESFVKHLGFVREGRVRQLLPDGDDVLVYGMLEGECRFLDVGRFYGNAHRFCKQSTSSHATLRG